jgi:hypothetical protein
MKKYLFTIVLVICFLFVTANTNAQEITKYDFIEIIVVQKANNSGKIKRIRVEEQPSLEGKIITIKEIEKLKGTSQLFNYMNASNWEFVDRQAVVSEENDPVWMSYIFKKKE